MTIKPYKVLKKETVFKHEFFELIKEDFETANGTKGEYLYHTSGEGVHAVGVDVEKKNLILTRQYRHPIREIVIDVAGGLAHEGENIEKAAEREFEEETGYKGDKPIKIGRVAVDPSKANYFLNEFVILNASKNSEPNNPDDAEVTEVFLLPINQAWDYVREYKIASPHSTSTIVKTLLYLGIKP